jgi:hypothetical protein
VQDLLSVQDPDWTAFISGDPDYLMRSAGATIRTYCGWHIAPSVTETLQKVPIGQQGVIMLPSLYVTDVAAVYVQANPQQDPQLLDPSSYVWFQQGFIQPIGQAFFGSAWYAGYYYEPGPYYLPMSNGGIATVTLTHGYPAVPEDIKQVAFETVQASGGGSVGGSAGATLPSSTNVKEVASPGFRLVLGAGGANGESGTGTVGSLTTNQKNRLAPYRIPGVK